jgi:hypothetical protein
MTLLAPPPLKLISYRFPGISDTFKHALLVVFRRVRCHSDGAAMFVGWAGWRRELVPGLKASGPQVNFLQDGRKVRESHPGWFSRYHLDTGPHAVQLCPLTSRFS